MQAWRRPLGGALVWFNPRLRAPGAVMAARSGQVPIVAGASDRAFLGACITRKLKPAQSLRCYLFSYGEQLVLCRKKESRTISFAGLFAGISVPRVLVRKLLLSAV